MSFSKQNRFPNSYTPNAIVIDSQTYGPWVRRYPVFPSAQVTVAEDDYMQALDLIIQTQAECVFCDGETFIIPEAEHGVIELLLRRFQGSTVEYGHAQTSEYCTLAIRAGVSAALIQQGHSVQAKTGSTPQEMVELALAEPARAQAEWTALFPPVGQRLA